MRRRMGLGFRAGLRRLAPTFAVVVLVLGATATAEASFAYRKTITIDGSRVVGGPHLDFPVLVSVVDPDLRTTANGGGVTSPAGYDIAFRAADGTTVLDWEIEYYSGTNGALTAWVRLPGTAGPPDTRVQNGVNTVFYLYYGDPTIGCCQTRQGWVWDANYRFVYHFDDASGFPVTAAPVDETRNGVGSRINPQGDAALQISWGDMGSPIYGGAWDLTTPPTTPPPTFGLTTDTFLSVRDGTLAANQPYTIEAWFFMDVVNANYVGIVTKGRDGGFNDWVGLWVTDTTTTPIHALALGNYTGGDVIGTTTLVAGRWYYGAVTSTPGTPATRRVFLYDTLQRTDSTTNAPLAAVTPPARVGDDSNGNWLNGRIDEVRFSNVVRSPAWLQTTARNEGCPSSTAPYGCGFGIPIVTPFLSVGAQTALTLTFTSSDCCKVAASTAATKTTLQTSDVQMVWDTAYGAGLSEVYSEEEANATVNRRGDPTRYNVYSMQANDGSWHFERDGAGTLQVVEASPARVRLRQLYDYSTSLHLDRTWTVTSYPRMAIDETFVLDSTQDIRGAQGLHPKGETTCADTTYGNTFFCAGNADGTNRLWLVTDNQSTYGDMLAVLYNNAFFGRAGAGGVYEQMYEAGTGANTYFARVYESSLLSTLVGAYRNQYLFYPRLAGLTSSGTQWQPYALDYRNPDPISPVTQGAGWFDANELTVSPNDFFNEAEGAYTFDMNPAAGLSFDLDGGTTRRIRPFFKIRQWRSLATSTAVTLEGANLKSGVDYTAAVKPFSRAYSCPTAACATSTSRANGGLAGATEFLADATAGRNFTLDFSGTNYLYLGSDSKFHGLNVLLATRGAGTGLDLYWEYWNGSVWTSLETVTGFTDQTANFTATGTVFWTADPTNWAKRTLVAGDSLPLFWVRVSRAAGSYTTSPVEALIKTDILLFQYCGDVAADFQTFTFSPPVATAVRLMSFAAVPADGSVSLEWRTGSELDNLGFHLYRGPSADGPWTRLTSSLIPGLGSSPLGQAYSWLDTGLVNGTTYYYRLEDVDTSAKSTFHGPVSAVPGTAAVPEPVPEPSPPGEGDGDGGGGDGSEGEGPSTSSCPSWILSAAPDAVSPVCTRYGDPESVSLQVLARDSASVTLELRTGGFWALHEGAGEVSGTVRVFVRGLDFPSDPKAPALPLRRALVDAVVGRQVHLVSAHALDLQGFPGLRPSAVGTPEMAVGRDGTVRPGRRSVAPPLLSRGYLPSWVARLAGTVFQGERKSAVVEISPVRFDGRQLVLATRVRVKLAFSGVAAGEVGTGSRGRALPGKRALFPQVLAQLFTRGRGLYAVRYEELFPDRPRGLSTLFLRLQRQGEAVAFHVEPGRGVFGPGSVLYFYADHEASSTDYSGEVAYELVRGSGARMGVVTGSPWGAAVTSSSTGSASFETNRIYQPGLLEAPDIWLWEAMVSGVERVEPFLLSGVASGSGQPAQLEVVLQGGSDAAETSEDHHVRVDVNGVDVGEAFFDGKRAYRLSAAVPASLLREGANELGVVNVGDTGVYSLVFLDRFEVSYPQASTVKGGVFEGEWQEEGTAEVGGVPGSGIVLDVTGPARWLTGFEVTAGTVRFQAQAGHRYVVVSAEGLLEPRIGRVPLSTLKAATNQADYLVIGPEDFLGAAEPLLERRRSQGLTPRAVSLEEIASEFGHGQASGEAIKAFVSYAYQSWRRPSPRYVLLLGDSTYDPRHFLATSWASPLPALWVKTSYLWTVSDPALGAVNGEDELPDLAIGRLPATTREQAEALVSKLLAWEESGQGLDGNAVLVADAPDAGGDFEADVEEVRASFLSGRPVTTLKVRELGAGTRGAILGAFDEGASVMSYVGHGGTAVWSSENVLNTWDVPSLRMQSRQPLLLTMNCLNGYFVAPNLDSLSEALVKAEGRGAGAALSPSGLSLDGPAHEYHRALVAELVSGRHQRLGDAILAAQRDYAETGLLPELLTVYHLLGDPAMKLR
jgi:hypothetical protein